MAKKMETVPAANNGNAAPSTTPAGRTRNRTSLSATEIRNVAATPALTTGPTSVRRQGTRKTRYSDPGPFLLQAGPSSLATGTRERRSIGTPSGASSAPTPASRSTITVSPRRRRSIVPSRRHRRHTLAVAPTRQHISSPTPEPVSQEIQFFPLKQALSARTRRALRRNALSEEMNNIDAEKRVGLKKNREELIRLRAELAESSMRLQELERELAAARYAPSEEPEPLPAINEEQDDDEDYNMGYISTESPGPHVSLSSARRSPASAEPQADSMEVDEAPASHRDQKIRDLESMIEALRHDIAQRAEEERLRAFEDEVFHDAEEQILHEENHALAERVEELTTAKGRTVSFDDDVEEIGPRQQEEEEEEEGGGGGYTGPLADDFEDDITDIEEEQATFRSSGADSGISISGRVVNVGTHVDTVADLGIRNDRLQQTIDRQGEKIREMEEELGETQMNASEREKAFNRLKRENEKLRRLEKELEEKVIELEEMEGERLENVGYMVVQTDEVVDQEKIEMEEKMDSLTEQVVELQGMISIVTAEKRETEARIAVATSQIVSLQSAAKADEAARLVAKSQIRSLEMQIANLEDISSEKGREAQHRTNLANARITDLQKAVEASEAAKVRAEAKILTVMSQAKEQEVAASLERNEVNARIAGLEAAVESGGVAKVEAEAQIATLMDQIKDHEDLVSEVKSIAQAQIADLQADVELSKVAKAEAEDRILILMDKIKDLDATVTEERREAEVMIAAASARIADLEATVKIGETEKAKAETQIFELKSQIQGLEVDSSVLVEEKDEMQKEIDELNERVEELGIEVGDLREENAGMRQEVGVMVQKGKVFEEAAETWRHDKTNLKRNVESLTEKVEELEDAAEVLKKAKASLETHSSYLSAQIVCQQKATELAEKTREKFERNVVELRSHIEDFEQAADISRNEKASFERDINLLRAQVLSLEDAQKLAGNQNQTLQKNIDELNAQIGSFEQAIETADQEKGQLQVAIAGLKAQIEALQRAGKVANQQKEALEQVLSSLNDQLGQVNEELEASRAENNLLKQEIDRHKSEIELLKRRLELSNQEKEVLRHELKEKVASLMGSDEQNRSLQHKIGILDAEIRNHEQASEIADEEKSIIQQKIRPYIQGEQSLDMAVEEVLTELVMAKNRADENERIKTELANKIRILAQEDGGSDAEPTNPEEMVERLTDRFRGVRESVERLYELCGQTQGGPFEGYNLRDFAWTGSNESALTTLGRLVSDMYEKVTSAQARAEEMKEGWEKEKRKRRLYGSYLEDIAVAVANEDQELPGKDQILGLVALRLSSLKHQIEAAEEKVEELNDSVTRKDNTIKDLETNIDNASQREMELNKKLIDSISAHNVTTIRLDKARIDIGELSKAIDDKDEEVEGLEALIDKQNEKECELLEKIEQQTVSHKTVVRELEQKREEAVADVEKRLMDMQEATVNIEYLANQAYEENALVVKNLRDDIALSQTEMEETNRRLQMIKTSHQVAVEKLEGHLAQSKGELSEVYGKLRELDKKSSDDISALEIKLRLSKDETKRQQSSLQKAITERDNVTKQLNAEIQSSQDAITELENKIQIIRLDAKVQHENDQKVIASLEAEVQTTRNVTEGEIKTLQEKICRQAEEINELKSRVGGLEEMLEEAEDSEKVLEEHLKAAESQSQLFQEEAVKAQQALEAEKRTLQQELVELKRASEAAKTRMQTDITTLKTLVEERSQRIQELEIIVNILQGEKLKLEGTVNELDDEKAKLEDMLDVEQRKSVEAVQNMANEATKLMARFGDVKNQFVRETRLRQAEGLRSRGKRAREEQDDEEAGNSIRMLPTPATSIVAGSAIDGVKKRESKRRRFDSGIGVEEDDEQFEGVSQVGV